MRHPRHQETQFHLQNINNVDEIKRTDGAPLRMYHFNAYSKKESTPAPMDITSGAIHSCRQMSQCHKYFQLKGRTPFQVLIVFPTRPISDLRFHSAKKAWFVTLSTLEVRKKANHLGCGLLKTFISSKPTQCCKFQYQRSSSSGT